MTNGAGWRIVFDMSTNATATRRGPHGLAVIDTPSGVVTFAGNLRINGTRSSWGYTAPDGDTITEYGFGTRAEAVAHAACTFGVSS